MLVTGPAVFVSMAALRPSRGRRRPPTGKDRPFLHVGIHKTGTTSHQEALHPRSRAVAAERVLYPNAARSFGGVPLWSFPAADLGFAAALAAS
jgi:hypothetical protein